MEPIDVFGWVDWQGARTPPTSQRAVRLKPGRAAPATINRRVAAVRAFFEFLVMPRECGGRTRFRRHVAGRVQVFLSGLRTHRDRAMVLGMLLGGLRSAEVRGLLLNNVDQGSRRLPVIGTGGRERVVPVDGAFFAALGA